MTKTPLDDKVCEAFAAHRAETPAPGEIDAAVATARARPHRRRTPRRAAIVIVAGTVLVAGALAALPGRDDSTPTAGGVGVLRTAAAAAAQQPAAEPFAGFRYARALDRWTYGTSTAAITIEQEGETWVDADLHGRIRMQAGRIVKREGDPKAAARLVRHQRRGLFIEPRSDPYVYGDGGTIDKLGVPRLPTEPAALAKALRDAQPSTLRVTEAERRFYVARELLTLLTQANASPQLRSAAFGALADMEGVRARGPAKDERGRQGEAVEIAFPPDAQPPDPDGPAERGKVLGGSNAKRPDAIQVIVDPESGDILSWTQAKEIVLEPATPDNARENEQLLAQTHVYLRTGQVDRAGERP